MNHQLKLLATATALLLLATACGTPAASPSSVPADAPSTAAPSSSVPQAPQAPQAPGTAGTDVSKAVAGFALAVPMQYDYAGNFSEGMAFVGTNKGQPREEYGLKVYDRQYSCIDKTGKALFQLDPSIGSVEDFSGGIATVYRQQGDKRESNFVDTTGKLLLDKWAADERGMGGGGNEASRAIYWSKASAYPRPKYFTVFWSGENFSTSAALYDDKLKPIIPVGTYSNLTWVEDTDCVSTYSQAADGSGLFGLVKLDGTVVSEPKYSALSPIGELGFAARVGSDGPMSLLLYDGTLVEPKGFAASELLAHPTNKANIVFAVAGADGAQYGVMDKTGAVLEQPTATPTFDVQALYSFSTGMGYEPPKPATPPAGMVTAGQFDDCQIFATGELYTADYKLTPGVLVGIADLAGTIVIQPTYEGASALIDGLFMISDGFTIDPEYGNEVATGLRLVSADEKVKSDSFKQIGQWTADGMVAVSDGSKWGYLSVAR